MNLRELLFGEKKWNPRAFGSKQGSVWVLVPSEFYPAMIEHIRASLSAGGLPPELVDNVVREDVDPMLAARRYKNWARKISAVQWADALAPLSSLPAGDEARLLGRAEALECARLWFTRALKNKEGGPDKGPIMIRITKDLRYRLGTTKQFNA